MTSKIIRNAPRTANNSSSHLWILAAVVWLSVAGMLVSRGMGERELVGALTVIASTGYLAIAVLAGPRRSGYGLFVLVALICCWIGDIVGPISFSWGLYVFLVAHLFLIVAFCTTKARWTQIAPAGLVLASIAVILILWFLPHVSPDERLDFIGYTAAISAMVAAAWGARHTNPWLMPAAVIFFVSDVFVARWRYGGGTIDGYLCYPLYYTACIGFAMSVKASDVRSRTNCATAPVTPEVAPESPSPVGSSRRPPQS